MTKEVLALPYECWRWIPGYEGIAQVSTSGDVKTVDRWVTRKDGSKQFRKGKILKPIRTKSGYLYVALYRDGKQRRFRVHRLVAETWLDNPENKPEVNHLDENKENCSVENLSYCDHKTNANWGTRNKRIGASQSKPVEAIDPKTGQVVKEFSSAKEAGRNGFNKRSISRCCLGKRKTHRGLVWKYKDDYDQESAWTPVKIGAAASLSKAVLALDPKTGQVVREFPSIMEAERNGFNKGHIWSCCHGKQRTHKGYIWRYKQE